nr:PREDICTED: ras GTPase-activating-like protein IQGAP2 [Equus przewalskii]
MAESTVWARGASPHLANVVSLESVGKVQFTVRSLTVEPTWQGYKCLRLSSLLMASPCCIFSKLPYDVTTEQALTYPEVQSKLEVSIENLRRVTDKVLSSIVSSLELLPYGLRYIAKVLKNSIHEKFPDATEDELLKVDFQG